MLRRLLPLTPAVIAVVAVLARVIPGPRTIDDAFITFRYASNLLDGLGFVYNPGERVLGTTTPLYTLLLAALAGLFQTGEYPWLALGVNALADAATCALLVPLGQRLSGHRAVGIGAGVLWALAPMSVTFAIGGMETSVFILLMTLTAHLYVLGQTRASALTAGLTLLTRPDGLLFVGPLALDHAVRTLAPVFQKKSKGFASTSAELAPMFRDAGIFLGTVLPWAAFATFYFGSPFTHSVTAKTVAYYLPPSAALVRLLQHYATPFFEHLVFPSTPVLLGLLVGYATFAIIGGAHAIRRDSRAWAFAAYPFLYFLVFAVANPLIFRWYLAPPLPAYFMLILAGMAEVERVVGGMMGMMRSQGSRDWRAGIGSRKEGSAREKPGPELAASTVQPHVPKIKSPITALLITTFTALTINAWTLHPDHGPDRPAPQMAWHQLELFYEGVGRRLATQVGGEDVVAAGDVGALGYYSGARILDTVGLMSPEAVGFYPLPDSMYVINYAVSPDLILDHRPEFVVILEVYGREGLLRDPRFAETYVLAETLPTDIYGSRGMLVFERRP